MADVFDIDIGGEDVQNDAQSDDDCDQDSLERWVGVDALLVLENIFDSRMIFVLLARQMTTMGPTQGI